MRPPQTRTGTSAVATIRTRTQSRTQNPEPGVRTGPGGVQRPAGASAAGRVRAWTRGLLRAAGYAPLYTESSLDDPVLAPVRTTRPHPARTSAVSGAGGGPGGGLVAANTAFGLLTEGATAELVGPGTNVYRLALRPRGPAPRTGRPPGPLPRAKSGRLRGPLRGSRPVPPSPTANARRHGEVAHRVGRCFRTACMRSSMVERVRWPSRSSIASRAAAAASRIWWGTPAAAVSR